MIKSEIFRLDIIADNIKQLHYIGLYWMNSMNFSKEYIISISNEKIYEIFHFYSQGIICLHKIDFFHVLSYYLCIFNYLSPQKY